MTRLSVIIVSYKVRDLVMDCLRSVFAAGTSVQLEVFVVDNASNDGTVERVQHEFPSVRVIANSQNLGFPLANNQALAESSGDVVLLLNPDTIVHEGALLELVQFFKRQTAGVVAGLNVRNADGTHQDCIHALPNFRSLVFSVLRIDRMFASSPFFNAYAYAGVDLPEVQQVGYVTGAALALNRMALEQLGGLDANLFWYEDIDICCRAWKLGFPVYFLPKARVCKCEAGSSGPQNDSTTSVLLRRSTPATVPARSLSRCVRSRKLAACDRENSV